MYTKIEKFNLLGTEVEGDQPARAVRNHLLNILGYHLCHFFTLKTFLDKYLSAVSTNGNPTSKTPSLRTNLVLETVR